MNWLMAEDALRNRHGHWFEYARTFKDGLPALGDGITILADRCAEPFIIDSLSANAVLPESIWHKVESGGKLRRLLRIPIHAGRTYSAIRRYLKCHPPFDLIFVPTVLPHHLLGWLALIHGPLYRKHTRVLLYFQSIPVIIDTTTGTPRFMSTPGAQLLKLLIRALNPQVKSGRVVFGVETEAMCHAMTEVTGVKFTHLPQPVDIDARIAHKRSADNGLHMLCCGEARYEKGSDLLQQGIKLYFRKHPLAKTHFEIHWIRDFRDGMGHCVSKDMDLLADGRVKYISRYLTADEYVKSLSTADVVLLPYRLSSYQLRGSRVVIEAMINGIPVVATQGTTLYSDASQFGAVIPCIDESAQSICDAIEKVEQDYTDLHRHAIDRIPAARAQFSLDNFRRLLTPCS